MSPPVLVITGGHHTSALEVAQDLKSQGWTIFWFGHRHSMWGDKSDSAEYREVTAAKIDFYDLRAGKFFRTLHPLKLIRIPAGFFQALFLLTKLKLRLGPRLKGIVSFGGYLAVPTVIAGWLLGLPSVTHEQTVVAGWANKLLGPFVRKIAVSWPSSLPLYPGSKVVLTGLPLRLQVNSKATPIKNLIYITGGKQGSHTLNQVVFAALPRLLSQYTLIHQTGTSDLHSDYLQAKDLAHKHAGYTVFGFDSHRAASALTRAEVVVGRSGAHTAYELAVLGKPCVLVPFPRSSHDEQMQNAKVLEKNGQAVILPQNQLSPQSLLVSVSQAQQLRPQPISLPIDGKQRLVKLIIDTLV